MRIGGSGYALRIGVLGTLIGTAGQAAMPDLADIRLGARDGAVTRVVLDLRGGDAPFSYTLSADGMTVTIVLHAQAASPVVARQRAGLVHAVTATAGESATRISISTAIPVSVHTTGTLAPEGTYKFYRIYLDLGAAPALAEAAAMAPPEAASEQGYDRGPAREDRGDAPAHQEPHPAEPLMTFKIGGTFERSVSDYTNSAGPTAALETGLFDEALEMELGTTPLLRDGHATWKSGLILKKPIELSENTEFEIGAGPLWLHRAYRTNGDVPTDSAGIEGVLEWVFWPGEHRSLGFYAETGYSYDLGKGNDKAVGASVGVLIAVP